MRLRTLPIFLFAVLGIFLYVGAESCMGRFLKPAMLGFGMDDQASSKYGPSLFFLLLTVGRLLGNVLLAAMSPRACFRISALLGFAGAAVLMTGSQSLAIPGVISAGLGFANIWPMLFSITVENKPECANELSGLMCMHCSNWMYCMEFDKSMYGSRFLVEDTWGRFPETVSKLEKPADQRPKIPAKRPSHRSPDPGSGRPSARCDYLVRYARFGGIIQDYFWRTAPHA